MKTLGERLKAARKAAKLSQQALADKAGVTQPLISQIERGKNDSSADLHRLARECRVSVDWLSDGIEPAENFDLGSPREEDYALIPQHDGAGACGEGYLNDHAEVKGGLAFKRDWLVKMRVNPANLKIIYADGDSMEPYIFHGDVVLFDESDRAARDRQVYVVRRPDGGLSIKRFIQQLSGTWLVRSDNPDKASYPDEPVTENVLHEMPIVGRVIWRGGGVM